MKVSKRYEDPKFDGYQSSPNETLRGILVGPADFGKTSIFRKTTQKKKSKEDKNKLLKEQVAYGRNFEIIDIPGGIGINENRNQSTDNADFLFKVNSSTIPFNTIFVVIKFLKGNFDDILKHYQSVLMYFKERDEFVKKSVVLVNNFDEYLDEYSEEDIKEQDSFNKKIIEAFSSKGFQNQIIFFLQKNLIQKISVMQCISVYLGLNHLL
jgi:GTPase SAR1 family protein